jgi:hypothetical protein
MPCRQLVWVFRKGTSMIWESVLSWRVVAEGDSVVRLLSQTQMIHKIITVKNIPDWNQHFRHDMAIVTTWLQITKPVNCAFSCSYETRNLNSSDIASHLSSEKNHIPVTWYYFIFWQIIILTPEYELCTPVLHILRHISSQIVNVFAEGQAYLSFSYDFQQTRYWAQ